MGNLLQPLTTKTALIAVAIALVLGGAMGFFGHRHFFPCPEPDVEAMLALEKQLYEARAERDMALAKADESAFKADSIVYIRETKTIKQYEKRVTDLSLDSLRDILLSEPRD